MNLSYRIFLILMLFATANVFAQLPNNIGFEKGNFVDWDCTSGKRNATYTLVMDGMGPIDGRHTIIGPTRKDELDDYGHFPVLCPNGSGYSIKLGNDGLQRNVSRISRTISVPKGTSTYSLVFNYAMVLDANDNHFNPNDQPFFKVEIFDVSSGSALPCPSFNFVATSLDLPGFTKSDMQSRKPDGTKTNPIYRDWTTAIINLTNFAGKDIRLEFTAADCNGNIHFGYAYLDIDEKLSLNPITGSAFCRGQEFTTLIAPDGFEDYVWSGDNFVTEYHGKSFRVPAIDKANYAVKLIAYPVFGCNDVLYTTLEELKDDFKLMVIPKVLGCPGTGLDLTAASIVNGSSKNLKYSYYYENELGIVYLPNPTAVLKSGTYYIRGTSEGGCTDLLPIEVIIDNPEITVNQPLPVRYPTKVDLSTTFKHIAGVRYDYFTDAAATVPMIDFSVNISGTYYIKATNGSLCSVIVPVKVLVNPPLPYTIDAPNTFTPNGDGINDLFSIKTTGYVTLTTLNIFNRYGQLVFTTRSINDYWTGNKGGSPLPFGTYYWVFEGTDDYYHTKMKKAASITIVR